MQPSNNETVSELVSQNESLTQTLNRFLKKHFNETIIEDTYQLDFFLLDNSVGFLGRNGFDT